MEWTVVNKCDYITTMLSRFLLALALTIGFSAKASACSCSGWEGGYISEFLSNYYSFWAVPVSANLKRVEVQNDWFRSQVIYNVVVLEDFGQLSSKRAKVITSPVDGASCGVQFDVGTPQFISVYHRREEAMMASSCTPELPYSALKLYLQTGEDTYIPSGHLCHEAIKLGHDIEGADLEACKVWKDYFSSPWQRQGDADYLTYIKLWRDKQKNLQD